MTQSMYERVLGADFQRLHPRIQERFGFTSADRKASVGSGVMSRVWRGKPYTLPFLYVGAWRRIMFPERLKDVAFTIENYAYVDELGRETMTWIRTFRGPKERRFDAYMVYSEERERIVDYLGTHQHLAVDIDMSVSELGGVRLRSGQQRFYERFLGFRFPMFFSGVADVHEWFDEGTGKFQIQVDVHNKVWGPLFGYRGSFDVEWLAIGADEVPSHVLPVRTERRE